MGAKANPVYDNWWDRFENIQMYKDAKLTYLYLKTGHRCVSGIYRRSVQEIEWRTGVAKDDAYHMLTTGAVHNVVYDGDMAICYVQDKLEDHLRLYGRGNKANMATSIIGDYHSAPSKQLWEQWRMDYAEYLAGVPSLQAFFGTVLDGHEAPDAEADPLAATAPKLTDEERVQQLLARYTRDLDAAGADVVLQGYEVMTYSKKLGKPVSIRRRIALLQAMDKDRADVVLAVCSHAVETDHPARTAWSMQDYRSAAQRIAKEV